MAAQLGHWSDIGGLFCVAVEREALWHFPDEDLPWISFLSPLRAVCGERTLPSSEAEAISESLKGLLHVYERCPAIVHPVRAYQSVSRTAAVCPRKRGICSGTRPFSLRGMTAKAPPPLASQLTERYSGFACAM
jgi:hypothetical protein